MSQVPPPPSGNRPSSRARVGETGRASGKPLAVCVEAGAHRVFACSQDWPGWCRSGKTEILALQALGAYSARYALVVAEAGLGFPPAVVFQVTERLSGNATTDFGAPAIASTADRRPLTQRQADRLARLVEASWRVFDRVARSSPAELRKGPRGGGRDRDQIVAHVADAEAAYARKLGIRGKASPADLRESIVAMLRACRLGDPLTEGGWLPRYAARRVAWHALDHAWEIEDRGHPDDAAAAGAGAGRGS